MPYHIKTKSVLNPSIGDVYYKGNNAWTDLYDHRKVYDSESDANDAKNVTVTYNGITHTPKHFEKAVVVSE